MMEDKSLNLNQPLLSVRRFGPSPTLTSHKREPVIPHRPRLKSGPVSNPGTVPFLWERTPGQPKQQIKPQNESYRGPPMAPHLPPGRSLMAPNQEECKNNDDKDQALTLPNGKGEDTNIDQDTDVENDKESTVSGDYVDALDALSRSESFFLNCSMSEWDDLDVKPSGSFSMDPHTRESMMDRFLPAAKAAVSEMPHYAPKRHPVTQENLQPLKQTDQLVRYEPRLTMRYSHYLVNEVEDEESDDDFDQHDNSTAACGLLPRFRFCLLNPITAMSMGTRGSTPSPNKIRPKSSPAGSFSGRLENCSMSQHSVSVCNEEKEASDIHEEQINTRVKGSKTFQQLIADEDSLEGLVSGDSSVEKILYVDTIQKVESSNSPTYSPNRKEIPSLPTEDSNEEEKLVPNVEKCEDKCTCGEVEDIDHNKTTESVESDQTYPGFPGPPPLPKSPSDSWLFRTMSAKNSKNPQNRGFKTSKGNTKWETIVKSANVQQRHLQGLMSSISDS